MPQVGKRLLEHKPKSLNRYVNERREGVLIHVDIPHPPHPLAAQCPTCYVRPGEPCVDQRKHVPWSRRKEIWLDQPHPARVRWAKKMVELIGKKESGGSEGI